MNIPTLPEWEKQHTSKRWWTRIDKQEEWKPVDTAAFVIAALIFIGIMALVMAPKKAWPAEIVDVARQEIGHGEFIFDNYGPDVARYMKGRQGQPWCAGFVSYCLSQAGYKLPYTFRARKFLDYGKKVNIPKPGDLAVFARGNGGHVGIVEYCKNNKIMIIEGNTGGYPAQVRRVTYNGTPKNLLAWVRVGGAR